VYVATAWGTTKVAAKMVKSGVHAGDLVKEALVGVKLRHPNVTQMLGVHRTPVTSSC